MPVERLHEKDYEDFITFADRVFSQELIRIHFQEDLPMCFGPDEEHMRRQYVFRDDTGRIRSAVGVIPYTYRIGNEVFSAKTFTNVCTDYRWMGKGCMRAIMERVFADLKEDGTDLVVLHGNRERYRYFGFEAAGISETADFQAWNIHNLEKQGVKFDFTFRKLSPEDKEAVRYCLRLYEREPEGYVRTEENFMDFMGLWKGETWLALSPEGKPRGYLNRAWHSLRELEAEEPDEAVRIVNSFLRFTGEEHMDVHFSPFDPSAQRLRDAAEYVTLGQTTRLALLRPERFLRAAMELKLRRGVWMPEGELVLASPGEKLLFSVRGGEVSVTRTEREAELTLSRGDWTSLLLGPCSPVLPTCADVLRERSAWFPLPFHICNTDLY